MFKYQCMLYFCEAFIQTLQEIVWAKGRLKCGDFQNLVVVEGRREEVRERGGGYDGKLTCFFLAAGLAEVPCSSRSFRI